MSLMNKGRRKKKSCEDPSQSFLYPTYKQQMREASAADFVVPDGEVSRGAQRVHRPGVPYATYKRQGREASTIPIVSAVAVEESVEGGDEEFRRRYEEERVRRQRSERERAEAERERERERAERAERERAEAERRQPEKEEDGSDQLDTSPDLNTVTFTQPDQQVLCYQAPDSLPEPEKPSAADQQDECSICLESLSNGEHTVTIKSCGHTFHQECIAECLTKTMKCPNCRTPAGDPQGPGPSGTMKPTQIAGYLSRLLLEYN